MSEFMQSQNSEFLQEKQSNCWMSTLGANEENTQNISLDVPELSVLLQITRYKFESFENIDKTENQNMLSTIELKCNVSGTISKFSKSLSACKCPTEEDIDSQNSSTNSLVPISKRTD
ncbi:hypothetical protein RN001_012611 [Aquatica leii]|uniref:Uncharacterized protein n=1 Tax=Aquatica leii TaxID=1421715 RepID=A0AAN7P3D7_9COLE|nr:hypothetical protein RN001_012611 [Aquatica leii]